MSSTQANPAPLGLMGFGMTTILLNIHNAGFFPMGTAILALGIFYGGIAQVIAGVLEFKAQNTFGATAFTSYGLFWLSLVFIIVFGDGTLPETSPAQMGWYLFLWGLFTAVMFVCTLTHNRAIQVVFGSLTLLFVLLAVRDWSGSATIGTIAGWEGIACGASAFYLAAAQLINGNAGRTVLPIGEPRSA